MRVTILGASSGFGREFTKLFANETNEITAISNDEQGLDVLKAHIYEEHNCEIDTACYDLTNEHDLDYVCKHLTDCDFLINSAGAGKLGDITRLSIEEEQYYMNLNIWAFHKITKSTLLKMIEKRRGNMINICSTASFTPLPNFSIYAATKAFAGSYTIALAKEVEKYDIRVMALCPGPTRTNLLSTAHFDKIDKRYGIFPVYVAPDVVAKRALKQFYKGRILYISGITNKASFWLDRFAPRKFANNILYKMFDDQN